MKSVYRSQHSHLSVKTIKITPYSVLNLALSLQSFRFHFKLNLQIILQLLHLPSFGIQTKLKDGLLSITHILTVILLKLKIRINLINLTPFTDLSTCTTKPFVHSIPESVEKGLSSLSTKECRSDVTVHLCQRCDSSPLAVTAVTVRGSWPWACCV